ncbi:hypothetical protein AB0759_12635 [Scytonema tolypothrichoides VB-61278_2]|uniref:Transposase n=1 Tax=Scytonema tolypothrichoides VB-61278_2 TaxID=3232314 RepID=A0ABW8WKF9_9CYAN
MSLAHLSTPKGGHYLPQHCLKACQWVMGLRYREVAIFLNRRLRLANLPRVMTRKQTKPGAGNVKSTISR